MKRLGFWLAIFVSYLPAQFAAAGNLYGDPQPAPLFRSYFESSGRIGNDQSMIQGDLFLTTLQTDRNLMFIDLRTNYVDPDKYEGNFGLGWRGIIDDCYIFGMYGYFDRSRTASENYFSQGTFGLEFMSVEWDFRANGYFPQTAGERLGPSRAIFNGTDFIIETPLEYAYYGTDLEVGKLLATTTDGQMELRGFLTGYYFDRDIPAYEEIAGGRVRLEMRMYDLDWLGEGSRVMLGAQYQYDDYRESISSGLVSVRIPFGGARRSPDRLQRRIVDSIVRDNDIVSRRGNLRERGLDPTTNKPFIRTTVIDGSTDAVALVAATQANSMIVANGVAGDINVATPLVLKSGQLVRSGGFDVIGEQTKTVVRFGTPGRIVGTDATRDVINLANSVELRELTIVGGRNNVFGDTVDDYTIIDSNLLGAADNGIMTLGTSRGDITSNVIQQGVSFERYRGTFSGNTVAVNSNYGVNVTTLDGTITNNLFTGDSAAGAIINKLNNGSFTQNQFTGTLADGAIINELDDGAFSNNDFDNVTNRGIAVNTMSGGVISVNNIDGTPVTGITVGTMTQGNIFTNTITGASLDAFQIGTLSGGEIDSNSAFSSGQHGFNILAFTAGQVTNNFASGNGAAGFEFGLINSTLVDGQITDNVASGNTTGFNFGAITGSPNITANTASNNSGDGVVIASITDAIQLSNNTANNNGGVGFLLPDVGSGFITSNTANNNTGAGMSIGDIGTTFVTSNSFASNGAGGLVIGDITVGNISSNTATNNTGVGFTLGIMGNGSVNGNTATGNTGHGFDFVDFDFGTMANNTASNNGGNGFNLTEMTDGSFTANFANSNTGDGIYVGTYDGSFLGDITSNSADGNGDDGFDIGAIGGWINNGDLSGNSSTNNTAFGYNIQGRTGGTASGNTASGNADNTLP